MGPGASDLSFSWRRQPKPQARAEPLWRSSAQLAAAPAQTLSALFTLAQAAGTGGALQRAARGLASRPTWRPKRTPGQRLCGAGGGVHGEESGPVAYLVLTLQPTGHYCQSSAAPQVPYERKSHGPEAQRKKLMLQRFQTCSHPHYHQSFPGSREADGGGGNPRSLDSWSGVPECLARSEGPMFSTRRHTWLCLSQHHHRPPPPEPITVQLSPHSCSIIQTIETMSPLQPHPTCT